MAGEWAEVPLGDVITLQRGFDLPSQDRKPGKVPIVSSSGVSDYHSEVGVKGPGVVTGRYGTIGQVFLIKEDYWPLNTTLWVKDFHGNDPHFASYLLRTVDFQSCSDKSSVPGVNRNDLHRIPVLLPPLAEQKAIAAVLGALDDKIELNRRMNATLEAMARALFQSWFVDFDPVRAKLDGRKPVGMDTATAALFPDSFQSSRFGPIPLGWSHTVLAEVCSKITDGAHQSPKSVEAGYPMASVKDMTDWVINISGCRHISEMDFKNLVANGCQPELGDILLAKDGATCLDTACEYRQPDKIVLLSSVAILRPKYSCDSAFLHTWLGLSSTKTYLKENFISGSAIPRVVLRDMKRASLISPPRNVLNSFSRASAPLREQIRHNHRQSLTLATLRDTLLPKLLSGELSVAQIHQAGAKIIPFVVPTADSNPASTTSSTAKTKKEFVEAIVISQLVRKLATSQYPLGRKRYNKLAYLAHRRAEEDVTRIYIKKAAGPYSPWAKYGGPEKIAQQNGYICTAKSGKFEGLVAGPNIDKIDRYLMNYPVRAAIDWVISNFMYAKNDELELLATIDFGAQELRGQGEPVTLETVKNLISTNKEWAPKLDREIFSDQNITRALQKLAKLFPAFYA